MLVNCTRCGARFPSAFGTGANTIIIGCAESCPFCGAPCATPDSYGSQVWEAVRQPDVTRAKVRAFRDTAKAAKAGSLTPEDAAAELRSVNTEFARLFEFVKDNDKALGILVAILALIVTLYGIVCSNENAAVSHADAQAQLAASQSETKVSESAEIALRNAEQAQRTIEEAQQRLDAKIAELDAVLAEATQEPPSLWQPQAQRPAPAIGSNRFERRKAKSLARRQRPR